MSSWSSFRTSARSLRHCCESEKPDPKLGATGKQRSLHNTYLTLPVLLMMISNHYPMISDQRLTWLIIGLVVVSGALARYFLVRTEVGDSQEETAWTLPLIGSALAVALDHHRAGEASGLSGRCQRCRRPGDHPDALRDAAMRRCPRDRAIKEAPKGIKLETIDELKRYAAQIETQAVKNKAMPLGNKTKMTDEERAKLGAWIAKQ